MSLKLVLLVVLTKPAFRLRLRELAETLGIYFSITTPVHGTEIMKASMWIPPPASNIRPCSDLDVEYTILKSSQFICGLNYTINRSLVKFRSLVLKIATNFMGCTPRTHSRTEIPKT